MWRLEGHLVSWSQTMMSGPKSSTLIFIYVQSISSIEFRSVSFWSCLSLLFREKLQWICRTTLNISRIWTLTSRVEAVNAFLQKLWNFYEISFKFFQHFSASLWNPESNLEISGSLCVNLYSAAHSTQSFSIISNCTP